MYRRGQQTGPRHGTAKTEATLPDGVALARQLRDEWRTQVQQLVETGRTPGLAVILVGDDPASQVYVSNKIRACEDLGIHSASFHFPAAEHPSAILAKISELNQNPAIHGILVQLPLPPQFDQETILSAISPFKDVDGFHQENREALLQGTPGLIPCTPAGVMEMLKAHQVAIAGTEAVVVGRSGIVGKPVTLLLLEAGATVTVCHSHTRDLAFHTQRADILVVAAGKPRLITGAMIKPGAVVIDVGINRLEDGTLCGDVDLESVRKKAALVTPVPGGVGPITIAMLLKNTICAAMAEAP